MRKVISTLSFIALVFLNFTASSQVCSSATTGTPLGGPASGGFDAPDLTPCVVQGTAYTHDIQFTMYSAFDFLGHQNVDSIQFLGVDNLPCGLCWGTDQADKRYSASEDGFLRIQGTTTDAAGQYKFALTLRAWINGGATPQDIPANLVDQTGIRLFIRVKTAAGACASVDTSVNATNLNSTGATCAGSNVIEVSDVFSSLQFVPNPMNTNATLSFVSAKNAVYTIRITDVTGKAVSSNEFEAKIGVNSTSVERNNLPAGVYFLSITDGKNVTTRRFSITE